MANSSMLAMAMAQRRKVIDKRADQDEETEDGW